MTSRWDAFLGSIGRLAVQGRVKRLLQRGFHMDVGPSQAYCVSDCGSGL
jgi:hypothetical protein